MGTKIRYRKSGLTLDEYENRVCYSCKNCIKPDSDGKGYCNVKAKRVHIYIPNKCELYDFMELIECNICNNYFRTLTRHTKKHGITIENYKEIYGYNRGSKLLCKQLIDKHKEI